KIVDIGSGNGKFCICAAMKHPEVHFYGIEQRLDLYQTAEKIKTELKIPNVHFICSNILKQDLQEYNAFYFFNSFYENLAYGAVSQWESAAQLDLDEDVDEATDEATARYFKYSDYLRNQLKHSKSG